MPATIYFLVSENGSPDLGRIEIPFPSTISLVDAGELALAGANIIGPLLHGAIVKAGVSFELDLAEVDSDYTFLNVLADLRDKARFAFTAVGAEGSFPKLITLPAYDESFTIPGSKALDLADAAVDAFVDFMIGGVAVTSGTIQPVDSRGYNINELRYAKEL